MSPTMVVRMLCEGRRAISCCAIARGRSTIGADADIVVAEPGRFAFDAGKSLSAVQWSAFDGREMHIRVAATFVRGQAVFDGSGI